MLTGKLLVLRRELANRGRSRSRQEPGDEFEFVALRVEAGDEKLRDHAAQKVLLYSPVPSPAEVTSRELSHALRRMKVDYPELVQFQGGVGWQYFLRAN
jgi:hypothetical protein